MVCPLIVSVGMGKVKQHRQRWPGCYRVFEHAVTWWFWNKAGEDKTRWPTPKAYLDAWYRGFKSSNKRMQPDTDHAGAIQLRLFESSARVIGAADAQR